MRIRRFLCIIAVLLCVNAVSGCTSRPNNELAQEELATLRQEVAALKGELASTQEKVAVHGRDLLVLSYQQDRSAEFDPSDAGGFYTVQSGVAPLLLSIDDIAPMGKGTEIKALVGNPTVARLAGTTLTITYGKKRGEEALDVWRALLSEKEVKLLNDLRPGAWTSISFTLPDAAPNDLGYMRVNASVGSVYLNR